MLLEEDIVKISYGIASVILHKSYRNFENYWEDLTQDIMLSVWKAMPRYDKDKGSLKNYIWSIAKHTLNHEVRQIIRLKENTVELTEAVEMQLSVPEYDPPEEDTRLAKLEKFISTLTRREKKAVELKLNGANNVAIYNALYKPKPYKKNIGAAMVYFWRGIEMKYKKWRYKQMQVNIAKIKGLMAEHGDSQMELARKLGVTRTTVNNYMTKKSPINLETVNEIAVIYKVEALELLTEKQ